MAERLPWIVTIVGLALIALQLRKRWPGWIGLPFLIVTALATLSAGVSPLVEEAIGIGFSEGQTRMGISGYYRYELPGAIGLLLLSYGSLLLGMLATYTIGSLRKGRHTKFSLPRAFREPRFTPTTADRGWRASLALFGFGVLCHAFLMSNLAKIVPVGEWATSRALFTSELSENVLFGYAQLLSGNMQIGGWGLLIFAAPSRARLRLALAANGLFLALQVLFGSRMRLIAGLYTAVLLYHYGVQPLRKRQWLIMPMLGLVAFSGLTIIRFDVSHSHEALQKIAKTLLVPRSISEAVWALRYWPDIIPFFGGTTTLHGWQFVFPNVRFVKMPGTWQRLVDFFFGGRNPYRYGGGGHFGFPVEQYIDLGYIGMVGLGAFYGLAIGMLYEWQAEQPKNPFLLLLAAATATTLFKGLEGKMALAVGEFFFSKLLPIGIMVCLTVAGAAGRRWRARLLAALYCGLMCYFLKRLTGLDLFDYLFACFLGFSYVCSLFLIHLAGEIKLSATDSRESKRLYRRQTVIPRASLPEKALAGE